MAATQLMGMEGFTWFVGEVVSNDTDTLKLGRVKIRAYHWHDELHDDQLPHAQLMTPVTSASLDGVGMSPTGIKKGTRVVGFFLDGRGGQQPLIMGTFHIIKDGKENQHAVNQLARAVDNAQQTVTPKEPFGPEPKPAYAAQYPYNKTFTTESGHAVEFDDTPGHERIHIYHKAGTYMEISEDGKMVTHANGDSIEVDMKNKKVTVNGDYGLTVNGDFNTAVYGNYSLTVNGAINITSRGSIKQETLGSMTSRAGGSFTYMAPAGMTIAQGMLYVNGGFGSGTGKSGSFQAIGGTNVDVCGGIITNISGGNS